MNQPISIGGFSFGGNAKPMLIAGPCVIESEEQALSIAEALAGLPVASRYQLVFKASYTKDNRTSSNSFRGLGLKEGLRVLQMVKEKTGLPVLSDVHSVAEVGPACDVLDVVQIPAFLCRQTSLLEAAAKTAGEMGRVINVKKGQFMAPEDMANVVDKIRSAGGGTPILTERGTTFGYHNLVVDFRGFPKMRATGCPVIYDVTHSLQRPAGLGNVSGGEPELAAVMARAAAAVPVDGLFIETHPRPQEALSDGASMLPLDQFPTLVEQTARIFELAREIGV
ncbi:MAG: 3-deoxy-8-phosphooctulonate synthase [Candidatus Krumholzibacteria bacterium]|nr:3-deoxy-8-phosphooctulonate synthase [Candidatus Krumholzibacteria bacterium]